MPRNDDTKKKFFDNSIAMRIAPDGISYGYKYARPSRRGKMKDVLYDPPLERILARIFLSCWLVV